MSTEATKTETHIPVPDCLSKAQQEVYRLVVQGLSNRKIAAKVDRTVKTVENHRNAINIRLGVNSPAALVVKHYETLVIPAIRAAADKGAA